MGVEDVAAGHMDAEMGGGGGEEALVEAGTCTYTKIEKLQESGVNVADIAKLKAAGFCTTNAIVSVMRKDLVAVKGLGEAKVDKIIEAAYKTVSGEKSQFFTAEEALVKLQQVRFKISTGASSLDEILRGGIEAGCITELYGEFRCGKTQLCHTLAVMAQLHETFPGRCLYIDTEGTFRPDRIQEICVAQNVDPEEIMANIITARAMTSEHLNALLREAATMMVDESSGQFAVIIIDSIMGIFRQDFSGRGELSERQQLLGKTLNRLAKLAHEFNVAVVLTNQVMADPSGSVGATFSAMPKPIGGHVLAHASTVRLFFRKGKGDERIVKIIDSPNLPEAECTVQIFSGGIRAPEGM
ncbi:unnamed protein product [Amoebophrya sp. A25]|nr:unnamed protein product [Amoebophrya sp. A25]|eukprot:GSA25T00018686001.1